MGEEINYLMSFSGELGTKRAGTQEALKELAVNNLKARAEALGLELSLEEFRGRLLLRFKAFSEGLERFLATNPGLGRWARFYRVEDNFPFEALLPARPFTFEVYVTRWAGRAEKERALDLKRRLLALLTEEARVRLSAWDNHPPLHLRFELEAYEDGLFLLEGPRPGAGGLPVGAAGKALLLFSGGPDSLLSAWLLLRRGLEVALLFFSDGEAERERLLKEAAGKLAYLFPGGRLELLVLDYRPYLEALEREAPVRERCLYCKGLMLRLAQKVLEREGAQVLATGEILGEQASQSLLALKFTDPSSFVLRPVIAYNKEEVFKGLSSLGLKQLAERALPPCHLAPKRPRTAPKSPPLKAEKLWRKWTRRPFELKKFTLAYRS